MTNSFNITFSRFVENSPFKATGTSMLPILHPDDVLYFEKTNFRKVKIDDFILAKKNNHYFVHRVIYKGDSHIVTKGDGNFASDGRIRAHQIIGRVVKVKRADYVFKPDSYYLIQSSYYLKEIIRIKKLLDKNRIRYVFLKGLPLHLHFGKSHPKRLYADCDILVDRKDLGRAHKIFTSQDYEVIDSSFAGTANVKNLNRSETSYQKKGGLFTINFDVHYEVVFLMTKLGNLDALYPQKSVEKLTGEFIGNREIVRIDDEPFYILDKKYLVIYLALHFFHHNFKGAYRLEFLNRILIKARLNKREWGFVTYIINQYHLGNFVLPVFRLLSKYYAADIQERYLRAIAFNRPAVAKTLSSVNIFDEESRMSAGIERFKNIFYLSPRPLWVKTLVFVDPQVIYHVLFVLRQKLSYFSGGLSGNRQRPS
jgi:signal peptidase I